VGVGRPPEAECVLKHLVAVCVVEVLLGADDMRDVHQFIIDDDSEVIGGVAVGFADDEVIVFI
jgi:hypothetical protein